MAESERQRRAVEAALAAEDRAAPVSGPRTASAPSVAEPTRRRAVPPPPESPTSYIVGGVLLVLFGSGSFGFGIGAMSSDDSAGVIALIFGVTMAVVGQVLVLMGVIAGGVRLGMRWHHYDRNP